MEDYLRRNFDVEPKCPSETAQRRWRSIVVVFKNPRLRFHMVANLGKLTDAERKKKCFSLGWQYAFGQTQLEKTLGFKLNDASIGWQGSRGRAAPGSHVSIGTEFSAQLMGFWGIEVKPEKPHPYHSDNVPGTLHITQATLGSGSSSERSVLQCSVGHKSPIFLCSLIPNKTECCALHLEFEEIDEVAFSVNGSRSIHLSGFFVAEGDGDHLRDEYDSDEYGNAAIGSSDSEGTDYDSEDDYENEGMFVDEDDDSEEDYGVFSGSPVRKSGVVIEEIMDDDKPADEKAESKPAKKKKQLNGSEDKSNSGHDHELIVRSASAAPVLESEDEDGFPVPASQKSKSITNESQARVDGQNEDMTSEDQKMKTIDSSNRKRKSKTTDKDSKVEREKKKNKKKKKQKEQSAADKVDKMPDDEIHKESATVREKDQVLSAVEDAQKHPRNVAPKVDANIVQNDKQSEQEKKKKKKKNQESQRVTNGNEGILSDENKKSNSVSKSEEKQATPKSSRVRTYGNGLIIEELVMGKPDGKRASNGKQVSVHYIGKLKKNGKIFDSNVGRAPFKFRLGIGQVIKGWDVGVEGMRIGDKRRLTIPPSMGYGSKGAGPAIPPNSWLEFDVELVDVR